jgi:two-component system sensor histidine kinase TctE
MSSIRLRLLKWLVGPIVVINLAGASLTYLLAWTPAQVAFDQQLADAVAGLAGSLANGAEPARLQAPQGDGTDRTWFVVRGAGGRVLAGDPGFPALAGATQARDGMMHGEPVRVLARPAVMDGARVEVGVARTVRRLAQVRSATLRSLALIEGVFTLALVGLVWLSVTNGLLPVARMRANLAGRDGEDLAPMVLDDVPYELAPVLGAFNELLDKVQAGARVRHDFLADMAHQLRTPLAGLKLQLEWMGTRHGGDPETADSIGLMKLANERMIRQTNQLLALARATPDGAARSRREQLDLAQLVQETVQYFVTAADRKGLDIGFDLAHAPLPGDAFLLRDLIDNLVDNAVRYTPAGGTVTVRTLREGESSLLMVEDSGPGIALEKRALVFSRFVRLDDKTPGSGLGLAVVRDIALAHKASIELADMPDGRGIRVTVKFPAA